MKSKKWVNRVSVQLHEKKRSKPFEGVEKREEEWEVGLVTSEMSLRNLFDDVRKMKKLHSFPVCENRENRFPLSAREIESGRVIGKQSSVGVDEIQ